MIKLTVYVEAGSEGAVRTLQRRLSSGSAVHIATFVHGEETVSVEDIVMEGDAEE